MGPEQGLSETDKNFKAPETGQPDQGADIEQILAAQKQFEADQQQQKDDAQKEADAKAALDARAGDDYAERDRPLADLQTTDQELKNMESANIQDKIVTREQTQQERLTKEKELEAINTQLAGLDTKLQLLNGVATEAQSKGLALAPELQKAIEDLTANSGQLKTQAGATTENIQALSGQEVSDTEMERYNQLKSESDLLDQKVVE